MAHAKNQFGLTPQEMAVLLPLTTPILIQDFLDTIPTNYEKKGETIYSPRMVLRERKAHCFEAAMLAALTLWIHGDEPLLINLVPLNWDDGHVIVPYQRNGYWGALSKCNHATLRYRDPVYSTVRELVLSYFHEYFANKNGVRTLRAYSEPFNLKTLGTDWITTEKKVLSVDRALDNAVHHQIIPRKNLSLIRRADTMEKRAGELLEWDPADPRT